MRENKITKSDYFCPKIIGFLNGGSTQKQTKKKINHLSHCEALAYGLFGLIYTLFLDT